MLTQAQRFLELQTALGTDILVAERLSGHEALGRMFEHTVTALAGTDDFSIDDLIGTPASLRIDSGTLQGEDSRYLHGIVSEVFHIGFDHQGLSRYQLTLVPWLWLLTRTSDCRIFQKVNVPEIVQQVFSDFPSADYKLDLVGDYPEREYVVQYCESDYNFVQRLLEHEGIYYFWEVKDGSHTMVITDQMQSHQPVPGFEEIVYRSQDTGGQEDFHLSDWQAQHRLTPGKVALNSYDFKAPVPATNTKLLSRDDREHPHSEGTYEHYDNPGDFVDLSDGERYAAIRRKEVQIRAKTILTRTEARGLFAGSTFIAKEIPRSDQNGEYLITATTITAASGNYGSGGGNGEDSFECVLTAIRKDLGSFVPERSCQKSRVNGPQTATVSGPSGEEIYVDKFGRVKVQFFWDRQGKFDAKSSCWIRVSQAWAGTGFGGMNIPRIGQEVIVDFLEGDPDRPIITGRVYNAATMPNPSNAGRDGLPGNTPPADLTKAAMMTSFKSNSLGGSGGSNEITMNDAGGAEGLFFKAQKDEIHVVGNDRDDTVHTNEKSYVGSNRDDTVKGKETLQVQGDRDRSVDGVEKVRVTGDLHETYEANHQRKTIGSKVDHIEGSQVLKIDGSSELQLTGDLVEHMGAGHMTHLTGARLLKAEQVLVEAPNITLKSGDNFISVTPGGIMVQGKLVHLNCNDSVPGGVPAATPTELTDPALPADPVPPNLAAGGGGGGGAAPPSGAPAQSGPAPTAAPASAPAGPSPSSDAPSSAPTTSPAPTAAPPASPLTSSAVPATPASSPLQSALGNAVTNSAAQSVNQAMSSLAPTASEAAGLPSTISSVVPQSPSIPGISSVMGNPSQSFSSPQVFNSPQGFANALGDQASVIAQQGESLTSLASSMTSPDSGMESILDTAQKVSNAAQQMGQIQNQIQNFSPAGSAKLATDLATQTIGSQASRASSIAGNLQSFAETPSVPTEGIAKEQLLANASRLTSLATDISAQASHLLNTFS